MHAVLQMFSLASASLDSGKMHDKRPACVMGVGVGVGVGRSRAARLAVELGCIGVTAAVDDLRRQPCEQRLCAFRAVDHVELPLRLSTDEDALDRHVLSIYSTPIHYPFIIVLNLNLHLHLKNEVRFWKNDGILKDMGVRRPYVVLKRWSTSL
jgi:hypothetical protein